MLNPIFTSATAAPVIVFNRSSAFTLLDKRQSFAVVGAASFPACGGVHAFHGATCTLWAVKLRSPNSSVCALLLAGYGGDR